jgi:hypothetical protein
MQRSHPLSFQLFTSALVDLILNEDSFIVFKKYHTKMGYML